MSKKIANSIDEIITINGLYLVTDEVLTEISKAENKEILASACLVNSEANTIGILTGNNIPINVPFSFFTPTNVEPDFTNVSIIDCGQTLKLGDYEASVEAMIKEHE